MRLRFYGHVARSEPYNDHARARHAVTMEMPKHWKRHRGRPRTTQTSTVKTARCSIQHRSCNGAKSTRQNWLADDGGNAHTPAVPARDGDENDDDDELTTGRMLESGTELTHRSQSETYVHC